MNPAKYKAILFDLDGTLLDTLEDIADAMNYVLQGMGFPEHDYQSYKFLVGDGMDVLVRRALPAGKRDEQTIATGLTRMKTRYGENWAVKTKAYAGIPETLDALVARGIKLTVLSNKPDEFTKLMVEKMLPAWRFDYVAGAKLGVPKKPDPAAAFDLAKALGLPPAEILYVGDTNTDMWTANSAGMYALGALWGFRPAEELLNSGAQALVGKPQEILKFL